MVESLSNLTSSWWMRWQIWVCCLTNPSMWWQICVWCVTNPSETHCVSLTSLSTHVQGGLALQRANSSAPIVSPPPACTSCCWCRPTCTFPLVTCSPRCIEARNRVAQNFSGIALQRIQAKDQNIANTIRFFTFQLFFPFLSFNFNTITTLQPTTNEVRQSLESHIHFLAHSSCQCILGLFVLCSLCFGRSKYVANVQIEERRRQGPSFPNLRWIGPGLAMITVTTVLTQALQFFSSIFITLQFCTSSHAMVTTVTTIPTHFVVIIIVVTCFTMFLLLEIWIVFY